MTLPYAAFRSSLPLPAASFSPPSCGGLPVDHQPRSPHENRNHLDVPAARPDHARGCRPPRSRPGLDAELADDELPDLELSDRGLAVLLLLNEPAEVA